MCQTKLATPQLLNSHLIPDFHTVHCALKKVTKCFCNIFYKTQAILLKFGT